MSVDLNSCSISFQSAGPYPKSPARCFQVFTISEIIRNKNNKFMEKHDKKFQSIRNGKKIVK
jgi:hypothetical protein